MFVNFRKQRVSIGEKSQNLNFVESYGQNIHLAISDQVLPLENKSFWHSSAYPSPFNELSLAQPTLFAVTFAVIFGRKIVGIPAVSLVLQLSTLSRDRVVVPVVQAGAAARRREALVWRLNARER